MYIYALLYRNSQQIECTNNLNAMPDYALQMHYEAICNGFLSFLMGKLDTKLMHFVLQITVVVTIYVHVNNEIPNNSNASIIQILDQTMYYKCTMK